MHVESCSLRIKSVQHVIGDAIVKFTHDSSIDSFPNNINLKIFIGEVHAVD